MASERSPPKKVNEALAVGKGATVQEFVATIGEDRLEIDVAPGAKTTSKSTASSLHTSTTPRTGAGVNLCGLSLGVARDGIEQQIVYYYV
jgi:hypothetical protein